jgi:hydrogenase 3 maturation protease
VVRMLFGIGNPLLGDDGVGNYIADRFRAPGWIVVDCGTIPENFTGVVRREQPEILILVDAADMALSPGEFRVVQPEDIAAVTFGTHSLPLNLLMEYLAGSTGKVTFIGIQPSQTVMGEGLSDSVREGADRLITILTELGDDSLDGVLKGLL